MTTSTAEILPKQPHTSFAFRLASSVLSGLLTVACFPSINLSGLVWLACLPLILAVVDEKQLGRAYLLGALSGTIFLAGSVYWFVEVMETYGRLPGWLALVVMVLFLLLVSTFWGVFGVVECWVARRSVPLALIMAPFLWVTLELARTYVYFTGFPWNLLGYAVRPAGLEQLASVTAVYGLSFLAIASSALLAALFLMPRERMMRLVAAAWFVALLVANTLLRPPALPVPRQRAILLQPNAPLEERQLAAWIPWKNPATLENLVARTIAARQQDAPDGQGPALLVWAESSAPFYFNRDPIFRGAMENMARQAHAYVITNTVTFSGPDENSPHNSVVVLDRAGREILQYDKIHLVPFGEYVPEWLLRFGVGKITSEVGNFVPGTRYTVAQTQQGAIGIFICYEAIFPQLVRRLVPKGRGVLVNVSDDAWYGRSAARFQHLEMAQFRAIESHRYLLRATNDGVTAVIDPYGRITARAPAYTAATLAGAFDYLGDETFYNRYGDVFAWLCVAATAVCAALAARPS